MTEKYDPYEINITDLSLYICDYCNLSCDHCYLSKGKTTINMDWIKWTIDKYPIEKAVLVGGEPTICPKLPEIIKILKEKKINITMSTNCKWMDWTKKKPGFNKMTKEDLVETMKGIDSIQISIEGRAKFSNKIRGPRSFKRSINAVDFLKKNGFDVFFRMTYSKDNFNEIPYILDLAKEKKIDLILFPYKGQDSVPLDEDEQERLYNTLWAYKKDDDKMHTWIAIPQFFCYVGEDDYCPAAKNLINIMPDGIITPCEMSIPPNHFILGDFKKGATKENLEKRIKFFIERIKTTDIECLTCRHHRICRSGCHETREYMNCPLKNQINIDYYLPDLKMTRQQLKIKINKNISIINKRKGC